MHHRAQNFIAEFFRERGRIDLISCDVKLLVVKVMCIIMYWLHTTVIQQDRIRGNIIPKIIFIIFVNLKMDSRADTLLAYK